MKHPFSKPFYQTSPPHSPVHHFQHPHVAMVVDSCVAIALDLAHEFNMLSYVYFPISATTLSMHLNLPRLDKETTCEYRHLPHPIKLPGCVPFHGVDPLHFLPCGFLERTKEQGMIIPSWAPQYIESIWNEAKSENKERFTFRKHFPHCHHGRALEEEW
ncbi:hypothetical protein VNO80_24891 [Phaseolus coccineus]|uniref:UDP-glycosyltransferase n=1 Tax=Phaseolus coccineus TaxID=3886 RepID=A0AAN9LT92_PHACN